MHSNEHSCAHAAPRGARYIHWPDASGRCSYLLCNKWRSAGGGEGHRTPFALPAPAALSVPPLRVVTAAAAASAVAAALAPCVSTGRLSAVTGDTGRAASASSCDGIACPARVTPGTGDGASGTGRCALGAGPRDATPLPPLCCRTTSSSHDCERGSRCASRSRAGAPLRLPAAEDVRLPERARCRRADAEVEAGAASLAASVATAAGSAAAGSAAWEARRGTS